MMISFQNKGMNNKLFGTPVLTLAKGVRIKEWLAVSEDGLSEGRVEEIALYLYL